jgi:hypothetical protein
MAIMFLQLIFLIVSVWLFCKCWFISWPSQYVIIDTKDKFKKRVLAKVDGANSA